MERTKRQSVMRTFINSGLHGPDRVVSHRVYALTICCLDGVLTTVCKKNNKRHHAEHNLLSYLKEMIVSRSLCSQKLTLYVNYSPCYNCSDMIVKFIQSAKVEHGIDIQFVIIFPTFYKIRRPSCEDKCLHKLPSIEDHNSSLKGLKRLEKSGVTLRPVNAADWQVLAANLDVHDFIYDGSAREREDAGFQKDFQQVMDTTIDGVNDPVNMFNNVRLRSAYAPEAEDGACDVDVHQYF
ncbi:hypothetical protein BaRGS_00027378 [Batillaria attramentaria]|uniref:CMP/dCMP-type deaminase domain-containing protein n=1 Tax=Batillaria attramentaria TaxID=370345 RepID=A0ABD0K2U5_9CAEN